VVFQPRQRQPRRKPGYAFAVAAVFATIALALYVFPAMWFAGDDDVCLTEGSPGRDPASGHSSYSFWPVGVECEWRFPDNRVDYSHFVGPPTVFRVLVLGFAGAAVIAIGAGIAAAGLDRRTLKDS
jgi:hypothetical protein